MKLKAKAIRLCLVEWFIYGTLNFGIVGILEFVQRMTPKGNTRCFRQGLISNNQMRCCPGVVVNKAFKQVAKKHTKIKQVKHQLKALGRGSERPGIMPAKLLIILRRSKRS